MAFSRLQFSWGFSSYLQISVSFTADMDPRFPRAPYPQFLAVTSDLFGR